MQYNDYCSFIEYFHLSFYLQQFGFVLNDILDELLLTNFRYENKAIKPIIVNHARCILDVKLNLSVFYSCQRNISLD